MSASSASSDAASSSSFTTDSLDGPLLKQLQTNPPESILNFRDVAHSVNSQLTQPFLRPGVLYRSARLDDATHNDRTLLSKTLGISTVLDLRSRSEVVPRTDELPLHIPGVRYTDVRMPSRWHQVQILLQLSLLDFFHLIWLALFSGFIQAKELIARKLLVPWGLTRLTLHGLEYSGPEIAASIRALLHPSATPLLVHCAQGKDRTGLVVAIILMAVDCPLPAIDYDYRLSDTELNPERADKLAKLSQYGFTSEFARTSEDLIESMDAFFRNKYGGVHSFLKAAGMRDDELQMLRDILLVKHSAAAKNASDGHGDGTILCEKALAET